MKKIIFGIFSVILFTGFSFVNLNKAETLSLPENFVQLEVSEQREILIQLIESIKEKIDILVAEKERKSGNPEADVLKNAHVPDDVKEYFKEYFNQEKQILDSLIYVEKRYFEAKEKAQKLKNLALENNEDQDFSDIEKREKLIEEYISQKENLVLWQGTVRHAFWHSLILDPQKAFSSYKSKGYHDYMVTKEETEKILQQLHERGWILVDYNDIYDFSNPQKITKKDLYLPVGKKPLIISIDDVSYYNYMKGHGFIERLVLNEKNEIVGQYKDNEVVSYREDGDLMMVVDDFIYQNPDFSYNGAKGIMAVTGYEGVLGYRTNTGNQALIQEAKEVSDRFKSLGWKFAAHSYSHRQFSNTDASYEGFKKDVNQWINEVWPIIGDTNIWISPFGYRIPHNDRRMYYLNSQGFQVYNPVSAYDWTREHSNVIIMDRIDFDGIRMTNATYFLDPFFDIDEVYDNENRPIKI